MRCSWSNIRSADREAALCDTSMLPDSGTSVLSTSTCQLHLASSPTTWPVSALNCRGQATLAAIEGRVQPLRQEAVAGAAGKWLVSIAGLLQVRHCVWSCGG